MNYNDTLNLVKISLSREDSTTRLYNRLAFKSINWEDQYELFNNHALAPLVSDLNQYVSDIEIRKAWKESTYSNIYVYSNLVKKQKQILDALNDKNIPVVVVKGTSAAKYYHKPQLRTMGDIDLLVRPEDYENAVVCLLDIGCIEITSKAEEEAGRHRSFRYNDVSIELHHYFSSAADKDKAQLLDTMIFNAISSYNTELPDVENGLVLLLHVRQHLEFGLGLRQIIDWFMFVRTCLDDEMWYSAFQEKTRATGLEPLAITATRMCQIYFGLTTDITWCKDADEEVCAGLMQYVMECGNFGRSREMLRSSAIGRLPKLSQPIQLFNYLQSRGEKNWKSLKKHSYLKPLAWVYQSCRYTKMAVKNKVGVKKLQNIYAEGQRRNEMFAALGIK